MLKQGARKTLTPPVLLSTLALLMVSKTHTLKANATLLPSTAPQ